MSTPAASKGAHPGGYEIEGIMLGGLFTKPSVEKCMNFEFREDDMYLVAYPKSGNTWLSEIIWLVAHDADTEAAQKVPIMDRVPLMEAAFPNKEPYVDTLIKQDGPRMMNTHLPYKLMKNAWEKKKPKTFLLFRNPKDLSVSYFHFLNKRPGRQPVEFPEYFDLFASGKVPFGSWFEHSEDWWQQRDEENGVLPIKYENMKRNPSTGVRRIAHFLGKDLTKEQIQKIVDFTSFDTMKQRPKATGKDGESVENVEAIFRKGIVGDWQNYYSEEQNAKVDDLMKEKLTPINLKFDYGQPSGSKAQA